MKKISESDLAKAKNVIKWTDVENVRKLFAILEMGKNTKWKMSTNGLKKWSIFWYFYVLINFLTFSTSNSDIFTYRPIFWHFNVQVWHFTHGSIFWHSDIFLSQNNKSRIFKNPTLERSFMYLYPRNFLSFLRMDQFSGIFTQVTKNLEYLKKIMNLKTKVSGYPSDQVLILEFVLELTKIGDFGKKQNRKWNQKISQFNLIIQQTIMVKI